MTVMTGNDATPVHSGGSPDKDSSSGGTRGLQYEQTVTRSGDGGTRELQYEQTVTRSGGEGIRRPQHGQTVTRSGGGGTRGAHYGRTFAKSSGVGSPGVLRRQTSLTEGLSLDSPPGGRLLSRAFQKLYLVGVSGEGFTSFRVLGFGYIN